MPNQWSVQNTPGAAAQATISKAGVAGARHVCMGISASIACGATAQTPIQVVLRDGATGVGAILWSQELAAPANGVGEVEISDMGIAGTSGNAMTLEFTAAGVAASVESVSLIGYDQISS